MNCGVFSQSELILQWAWTKHTHKNMDTSLIHVLSKRSPEKSICSPHLQKVQAHAKLISDVWSQDGGYSLWERGGWKRVQGTFPGVLEKVFLLLWLLVTWVCSVCENHQPVNLGFIHFFVCMLYFNNDSFLKGRWRKRTQWRRLS